MGNQGPPEVHDRDSAIRFVRWCAHRLGLGYHPDTRFGDYVGGDGRPVFSAAEAHCLDALTQQAFAFCDPYEIAVRAGMEGDWWIDNGNPLPPDQPILITHEPAEPFATIIDPETLDQPWAFLTAMLPPTYRGTPTGV